jgi:DnaJ-class molecular chaperone
MGYDDWKTREPEPQPEQCKDCNGEGSLEIPDPQHDDPYYCRVVQCQNCDGNGWL